MVSFSECGNITKEAINSFIICDFTFCSFSATFTPTRFASVPKLWEELLQSLKGSIFIFVKRGSFAANEPSLKNFFVSAASSTTKWHHRIFFSERKATSDKKARINETLPKIFFNLKEFRGLQIITNQHTFVNRPLIFELNAIKSVAIHPTCINIGRSERTKPNRMHFEWGNLANRHSLFVLIYKTYF